MNEINKDIDEDYKVRLNKLSTASPICDKVGTIVYLKSDKELKTPMIVSCVHMALGYLGTIYVEAFEVVYMGGDGIVHRTILSPETVMKEQV